MKDYKILISATFIATVGWFVNRFLDGNIFIAVCNGSLCASPFEFFTVGLFLFFVISLIFLYKNE